MENVNIYDNWKNAQKQYRSFVYFGGAFSFILIIVFIILKTVYIDPTVYLFSEVNDAIIFEIGILCCGAIFGSAVVGFTYDQYQKRFVQQESIIAQRYIDEGIIKVFKSANDPNLIDYITELLRNAKSEIIAVGLGLGIFSHNQDILKLISERVNKESNFRACIYIGDEKNPGVINRVKEEKEAHSELGLSYYENWVERYPKEINSFLSKEINSDSMHKYTFKKTDTFTMISFIKIDNIFLFFPYGTPNIRGSQSPWIAISADAEKSEFANFLKKATNFYK